MVDPNQAAFIVASLEKISVEHPDNDIKASADADGDFWSNASWARPYNVQDGVLKIPVTGVLLNNFPYQLGSWATGYEYITEAINRGVDDSEVTGIALIVNSPGGIVNGCFDLSDLIFESRDLKPIKAFVTGGAYSAAFALASAASEIVVGRSSGTGSVGVVTSHVDYSESMKQMGLVHTFVFAGKHKVDGNPYEKLSDDAKARMQARIDRLYTDFVDTVARNRGMDAKGVRQTEALMYDATDSVSVGFADIVGKIDEHIAGFSNTGDKMETTEMTDETTFTASDLAAARAEGVTEGATAARGEARDRITAIMGSEAASARPKAAIAALTTSMSADDAIEFIGKLPEETAQAPVADTDATDDLAKTFDATMQNGAPNVGADVQTPATPAADQPAGMSDYDSMVAAQNKAAAAA